MSENAKVVAEIHVWMNGLDRSMYEIGVLYDFVCLNYSTLSFSNADFSPFNKSTKEERNEILSLHAARSQILNLALVFLTVLLPLPTLASLWKTSGLLTYVDIFVGKFIIADFLGVFGRSSLVIHL